MTFAGRNGLAAGSMSSLPVRAPNAYHCLSCPEALPAAIAQVRHFIFTTLPVQSTVAELEASRLLAHPAALGSFRSTSRGLGGRGRRQANLHRSRRESLRVVLATRAFFSTGAMCKLNSCCKSVSYCPCAVISCGGGGGGGGAAAAAAAGAGAGAGGAAACQAMSVPPSTAG